jgi:hypothetical protein
MTAVIFRFFNRTPISRVRDCYGLVVNSEISGGRQVFGRRQRFDHFDHGELVQTAGTVREESLPIKAGHWRAIPRLETTCTQFSINKEENMHISGGPGRSQQLQILPSLNSKAFSSGSAYFSCCANISMDANVFPGAKFLASA